jgi:transposase/predicted transcriptional regulator
MPQKKTKKKQRASHKSGSKQSGETIYENVQQRLYADIVSLRNEKHLTYSQIAQELGVSKYAVWSYLSKWKRHVPVKEISGKGRPKKVDDSTTKQIRSIVATNKRVSSRYITNKVNKSRNNMEKESVSEWTVRRHLKRMSYKNTVPLAVPNLTDIQKAKRIEWCRRYRRQSWKKVLFTDESYVDLERCKIRVWHKTGNRPVMRKSKFSKKVMLWGGICSSSRTPIIVVADTMNSDRYIEMLRTNVLPWISENMNSDCIFQQDNASSHTSKKTKSFTDQQNIKILDWPPNSPDLNPIENIWFILKNAIEKRFPKNLEELKRFAVEEWGKIPQSQIRDTIKSMKTRISQVVERNGETCDY